VINKCPDLVSQTYATSAPVTERLAADSALQRPTIDRWQACAPCGSMWPRPTSAPHVGEPR
jgi:hypothetical protein